MKDHWELNIMCFSDEVHLKGLKKDTDEAIKEIRKIEGKY